MLFCIEHARFAQAGEIACRMDRQRHRQCQEALRDQEHLGRQRGVDDEEAIGHAREHLRTGQRAVDGMADEVHVRPPQPAPAADWMPETIAPAPNSTKQPTITVAPKRQFSRPVSIMKPTAATAMTATAVATLPSSVPWSQPSAATIGPEPCGSTACARAATGASDAPRPASHEEVLATRDFSEFPDDLRLMRPP
jgi:hypothetical protein